MSNQKGPFKPRIPGLPDPSDRVSGVDLIPLPGSERHALPDLPAPNPLHALTSAVQEQLWYRLAVASNPISALAGQEVARHHAAWEADRLEAFACQVRQKLAEHDNLLDALLKSHHFLHCFRQAADTALATVDDLKSKAIAALLAGFAICGGDESDFAMFEDLRLAIGELSGRELRLLGALLQAQNSLNMDLVRSGDPIEMDKLVESSLSLAQSIAGVSNDDYIAAVSRLQRTGLVQDANMIDGGVWFVSNRGLSVQSILAVGGFHLGELKPRDDKE